MTVEPHKHPELRRQAPQGAAPSRERTARVMGRELRRVPLDFDAPLNKVWEGYVSPEWRPCPSDDCENGYTLAAAWLNTITHLLLIAGGDSVDNRKSDVHPWLRELALAPKGKPGPQLSELTVGLAGRSLSGLGHDAIDRSVAARAIAKAAGMPDGWDTCPVCNGHSIHPDDLAPSEAFEWTEPPEGPGYQLWETTSEGSPIGPVFTTLDDLCEWAATSATTFASAAATKEQWRSMLNKDFVYYDDGNGNVFI